MAHKDAAPRSGASPTPTNQQSNNSKPPTQRPRRGISRSRKRTGLLENLLDALRSKKGFKRIRRLVINIFGLAFLIVVNLFGLAFVIVRYGEWLYRELAAAFGW